ncbi:unnamed protein product [Rhizoctonia solani]|uniref:Dienelactone hydrolase domain-containing protein n=1 Tax=Rhizoctonia solani TaxID=456999 RepID=A0A8H3B8S8_9AGAM|nr:unnamed protein product [Rhizoctonia solani]
MLASYKPRGKIEYINGTPTYIIGEKSSKKAIVVAMDAFGMVPLTQQGCDVLASYGFYILMPDLLGDQVVKPEDLGFDTPEKKEKRRKWFASAGNPEGRLTEFVGYGEYLKAKGFAVGSLGFCWGAKLALLASRETVPYDAIGAVHPTLLKPEDAALCKVPLGLYPSKDEDPATMESFIYIARDYKLYSEAFHGFAAARADLENPVYKSAVALQVMCRILKLNMGNGILASNAPVAWFQSPDLPNASPKPELNAYIYQGETEQKGSGPVGTPWIPVNPNTDESTSTTTERTKLDSLFPSLKPLPPVFHVKKEE